MSLTLDQLPARIQNYLGSFHTSVKNIKLTDRYKIPESAQSDFALLVADAFLKKYELKDLPTVIQKRLKMKAGKPFLMASELIEQHFVSFPDYFGDLSHFVSQWQQWGRQLGARIPSAQLTNQTEKNLAKARRITSEPLKVTDSPVAKTKKLDGTVRKTQSQQPKIQKIENTAVINNMTPTKVSTLDPQVIKKSNLRDKSLGRTQFLSHIKDFSIDALRPAGKSGGERLVQVSARLNDVVTKNPQDKPEVAQAFKQSKLFSLYKEQGQESAQTGQPIDKVIYSRYESGKPYLLKEEFAAVSKIVKAIQ